MAGTIENFSGKKRRKIRKIPLKGFEGNKFILSQYLVPTLIQILPVWTILHHIFFTSRTGRNQIYVCLELENYLIINHEVYWSWTYEKDIFDENQSSSALIRRYPQIQVNNRNRKS